MNCRPQSIIFPPSHAQPPQDTVIPDFRYVSGHLRNPQPKQRGIYQVYTKYILHPSWVYKPYHLGQEPEKCMEG